MLLRLEADQKSLLTLKSQPCSQPHHLFLLPPWLMDYLVTWYVIKIHVIKNRWTFHSISLWETHRSDLTNCEHYLRKHSLIILKQSGLLLAVCPLRHQGAKLMFQDSRGHGEEGGETRVNPHSCHVIMESEVEMERLSVVVLERPQGAQPPYWPALITQQEWGINLHRCYLGVTVA